MTSHNTELCSRMEFPVSVTELELAISFAKRHGSESIMMEVEERSIGFVISVSCRNGTSKIEITNYDRW